MIVKVSQSEKKVSAWIIVTFENITDVMDFHKNKHSILYNFIDKNNLLPPQDRMSKIPPVVYEEFESGEYTQTFVVVNPMLEEVVKNGMKLPFSIEVLSSDFNQVRYVFSS